MLPFRTKLRPDKYFDGALGQYDPGDNIIKMNLEGHKQAYGVDWPLMFICSWVHEAVHYLQWNVGGVIDDEKEGWLLEYYNRELQAYKIETLLAKLLCIRIRMSCEEAATASIVWNIHRQLEWFRKRGLA